MMTVHLRGQHGNPLCGAFSRRAGLKLATTTDKRAVTCKRCVIERKR